MKAAVILAVVIAIALSVIVTYTAGCSWPKQVKADPNVVSSFINLGTEGGQPFRFVLSKAATLFFVLVILLVAGLIMALALKMPEGWGVALAGAAGAAFVVAIASWGVWIGLAVIAGLILYIVLKLNLFKKATTSAVQYAEGLKTVTDKEKVETYNETVNQPLAVRKVVAEIKAEK